MTGQNTNNDKDIDPFGIPRPEEKEAEPEPKIVLPIAKKDKDNALVKAAAEAGVMVSGSSRKVMDTFVSRAKYGHQAAMPMRCKGMKCPYLSMCPLHEAGETLPLNKRCPVENALVEIWVTKHIESLSIDPNNPEYAVDMDMVYELAGLELVRNRAASHLSDEPALFKEKIVGYSPQGAPIYDDRPNLSLLILEKYGKRVDKLREQLLATRREQAKLGKLTSDSSVRAANIRQKAQRIVEARREGGAIEDAEFEVKKDD